jgi:lysophospholipase L1-like esterase
MKTMIYQNAELHNVVELYDPPDGIGKELCRIPRDLRAQLNDSAKKNAVQGTGCEVRFNLQGDEAVLTLQMRERPAIVEIYSGAFLTGWQVVTTEPTEVVVRRPDRLSRLVKLAEDQEMPFDPALSRVMLPWRPPVRLLGLEGEVAPPSQGQVPHRRYLAYGSSITHGNNGLRASGGYVRRTAQRLGVDLLNLGFGGGAHCEFAMADYIAARDDWDVATLELGINMVSWLDTAVFSERLTYFVTTIAESHPETWIFCIDMFPFHMDFDPESEKNHAYRAAVRDLVEGLDAPKLVYFDGRDLMRDITGLTADLVHPSPVGMEEISENLASRMVRMIDGTD